MEFTFKDDFAPSAFTLLSRFPEETSDPWLRVNLYNQHIYATLRTVLDDATKLGCHSFAFDPPDGWPNITRAGEVMLLDLAQSIAEKHDEISPKWLTISCYVHTLRMCARMVAGEPIEALFPHLPIIGATLRELELVQRNRKPAAVGRKVTQGSQAAGDKEKAEHKADGDALLKAFATGLANNKTVASIAKQLAKERGKGEKLESRERRFRNLRKKVGHLGPLSDRS